ncbi:flagellar protein FlgN [Paenibacillus spiritus]|uniref:Flagellar protein FlgN n=1 Tax=Paenibacillus spiritus TaxID=2496557 RepID=A0A5J5FVZ8_9BACL|nr:MULTISPECIES: flagellar protein FlgN [Paenibacillus]KAA8997988.1 flagellar protein FlgN [Paenibacillus spiritus]
MSVTSLIELLERLDDSHRQMLDLAASKKQAIMTNNIDQLTEILTKESRLMKLSGQLEKEREQAAYTFLQSVGIRSNLQLNLTELSRLVFDPDDKARLLHIQGQLADTLSRLKKANELNQRLIEQSLDFIDYSLDLLVGRPSQEVTYQHPASGPVALKRPGLFDARG